MATHDYNMIMKFRKIFQCEEQQIFEVVPQKNNPLHDYKSKRIVPLF